MMEREIILTTALPPEETNLSKTESKRESAIYKVSYPFVVSWVSCVVDVCFCSDESFSATEKKVAHGDIRKKVRP